MCVEVAEEVCQGRDRRSCGGYEIGYIRLGGEELCVAR